MAFTSQTSHIRFFSVVGPAYVAEGHQDRGGHLAPEGELEQLRTGVTGLWVSFFAAVGIALINNSQTARAVNFAAAALH